MLCALGSADDFSLILGKDTGFFILSANLYFICTELTYIGIYKFLSI